MLLWRGTGQTARSSEHVSCIYNEVKKDKIKIE